MENKQTLLDKVNFLFSKSISKEYSADDFSTIVSFLPLHSNDLVLGKVFGYSVSDYAFASLVWIGSVETLNKFDEVKSHLSSERLQIVEQLIKSELYKQY